MKKFNIEISEIIETGEKYPSTVTIYKQTVSVSDGITQKGIPESPTDSPELYIKSIIKAVNNI